MLGQTKQHRLGRDTYRDPPPCPAGRTHAQQCAPCAPRARRRLAACLTTHATLFSVVYLACGAWLCMAAGACRTTASSEAQADSGRVVAPSAVTPARVVLTPAGRDPVVVNVEVVDTPDMRQRGLMYRKQLAPDAGMLFLFDQQEQHTFWMHNTLIPLDMIFIKSDWTVLGIVENATPLTDSKREVPGASQYVLEVNAGFSRRVGLQAGTLARYLPAGSKPGS
ncbi:MAG: hypothetical protein RL701_3517 [Pseudomonadota bacterium]